MLAKSKMPVFLSVALIFILGFSTKVFAQANDATTPVVKLGNINAASHTTIAAVLAQPKLVANREGHAVTSFTVSLVSNDKNATVLVNPIVVKGAELNAQVKDELKKYENKKTILKIDAIQIMGIGRVFKGEPLTFTLDK